MHQIPISARKLKAFQRAEALAREIRRQLALAGGCYDNHIIVDLLLKWMRYAGKRSY